MKGVGRGGASVEVRCVWWRWRRWRRRWWWWWRCGKVTSGYEKAQGGCGGECCPPPVARVGHLLHHTDLE